MNYVKVEDGKITLNMLPKTGTLKDGSTVSNYHLLPHKILLEEGWLPLEDEQIDFNKETHFVSDASYEILHDKVIRKPIITEKVAVGASESVIEDPEERIAKLEKLVEQLLKERGE